MADMPSEGAVSRTASACSDALLPTAGSEGFFIVMESLVMKHLIPKTMTAVPVLALALAVGGCGGSSSSDDDMMTMTPAEECRADGGRWNDDMTCTSAGELAAEGQMTVLKNAANAVNAATSALSTPATQDEIDTLTTAVGTLKSAIDAATNLDDGDKAGYVSLHATASGLITTAQKGRDDADDAQDTADMKAMTAKAKALKKAIDTDATSDGTAAITVTPMSIPAIDLDGAGTGTDTSAVLTLKKGDAVAAMGSWMGMDYAGEAGTGDAKTTGMVRAYSNAEASKSATFASEAGEAVHGWARATTGTPADDYTVVTTTAAQQAAVGGFPTTGTHRYDEDEDVTGTFMGASGTYTCNVAAGCASAVTADGINLGDGWLFKAAPGATLQNKDGAYLQFGWWVRQDKDGPTHAGAFRGMTGTPTLATATYDSATSTGGIGTANLVGEATYTGKAAGKFAVSDPLRPANDNAGHFTADAKLMANFQDTQTTATDLTTLTGTIDNFRLNDGSTDPGWSVELQKAPFDGTNVFGTVSATSTGDRTVWSIGDGKGASSGEWEAQMYYDKASDENNTPHSVVGTFESNIGSTHSMAGAFGAEREMAK